MKKSICLLIALSIYSCNNITLSDGVDPTDFDVDEVFEFPVSSEDSTGIIQLPLFFRGDTVKEFRVLNSPLGSVESYAFPMNLDFPHPNRQFRFIKYVADHESINDSPLEVDALLIEITTTRDSTYTAAARPVMLDYDCNPGNSELSWVLQNHHIEVRKDEVNSYDIWQNIFCPPSDPIFSGAGNYLVQLGTTPYSSYLPEHLDRSISRLRSELLAKPSHALNRGVWENLPEGHHGLIVPDETPVGTIFQFAYANFIPKGGNGNDPLYTYFDQYGFYGITEWNDLLEHALYGIITFEVVE